MTVQTSVPGVDNETLSLNFLASEIFSISKIKDRSRMYFSSVILCVTRHKVLCWAALQHSSCSGMHELTGPMSAKPQNKWSFPLQVFLSVRCET